MTFKACDAITNAGIHIVKEKYRESHMAATTLFSEHTLQRYQRSQNWIFTCGVNSEDLL